MSESAVVTVEQVLQAAAAVEGPVNGQQLIQRGLLREVKICDGNVAFELVVGNPAPELKAQLEQVFRRAVMQVPGVTAVNVRFGAGATPAAGPKPAPSGTGAPLSGAVPGVAHLIAVGSGKGGVGKSTVAVNLAAALAQRGLRVGLLDADVYGPSVPMMMGIRRAPEAHGGRMIPLERHGVKLMSLGFLLENDAQHVTWRGPMVGNAVKQMLLDSEWGELDFLLVDLPPGTGDAQLTLAQSVPISGAVIVMTSQDVAVNIASKAVGMFRSLNVPILGVVGNMDTFACPHCGTHSTIFTRGGSEAAATGLGVPFLGSIPLDPATVEHGDLGTPTVVAAPASAQAAAFRQVADRVLAEVTELVEADEGPVDPLGGLGRRFGH